MTETTMCSRCKIIVAVLAMLGALTARAQVLPDVNVPVVPTVTETMRGTLDTADRTLRSTNLRDLRKLQVRDLLRRHRNVVERGEGEPVVRREILSLAPSRATLDKAKDAGFTIAREEGHEDLGTRIVVLLAPERMSVRRALRRLQELDPEGTYDYNHIYFGSGDALDAPAFSTGPAPDVSRTSADRVRVGLIDSAVLQAHPVFATTAFHTHGCGGAILPNSHGTAVASLIAMQIADHALDLYSADVYCEQPTGGSVSAIAAAFAWMAREQVPVINVSLVGPPNRILEKIVQSALERGHVIVAAVGNDGPNAKPLYPAAYEGVVGVTGVDRRERALPEALRGAQVDFAAAGAGITAANLERKFADVRGTSFAAPIVAALLALDYSTMLPNPHAQLIGKYAKVARDLGKPGFDRTYGFGLLSSAVVVTHAHRME